MNRKHRRAMRVQGRAVGVDSARAHPSPMPTVGHLFGQAVWHQHHGKPNEAVKLYKQVLALQPDHAEACNNLGCVLLAQGDRKSTRLNSSHSQISYAVFCLKKKKKTT